MKNRVAMVSLIIVLIITLAAIILPMFWPYSYEQQLGVTPGKPVDASFKNLAPFEYGKSEQVRIDAGEKVFPHVFGTDSAGRDYFIRVVYGTRISLAVGFFASIIVLIVGMVAMRAARVFKKYWGKYTDMGAAFLDNLQGLETLKTFDADERAARVMDEKAERFRVMTMNVLQIQLRSLTA